MNYVRKTINALVYTMRLRSPFWLRHTGEDTASCFRATTDRRRPR